MKKIGILGSGIVGQTLGNGFIQHGFEVMIGTSDASKLAEWKENSLGNGSIGSFDHTASFGEIVVLAVKGTAALVVLGRIESENLHNKTIIDTTNPLTADPPDKGVLKFTTTLDKSLMEQLQKAHPNANFVKAFNSVGNAVMVNPDYGDTRPTMFICGNKETAKKEVIEILDLFGHDAEDLGGVESARAIEPLCILWCIPGFLKNQWTHAFRLLKLAEK